MNSCPLLLYFLEIKVETKFSFLSIWLWKSGQKLSNLKMEIEQRNFQKPNLQLVLVMKKLAAWKKPDIARSAIFFLNFKEANLWKLLWKMQKNGQLEGENWSKYHWNWNIGINTKPAHNSRHTQSLVLCLLNLFFPIFVFS